MRRVLVLTQPTDGGVFRHVRDLAAGLPGHGFEVVVCGPFDGHQASKLGARTIRLPLVRRVSPAEDARSIAILRRTVRSERPDVIHAHSSKAGALARLARAAYPRVPVVYTPHGFAYAGYFEHRGERGAYRVAEGLLSPLTSRLICVCEAERRLASAVGVAGRARVVHNGVSVQAAGPARPAAHELGGGGPVIGAVSLLRPGKGIETLLEAMPDVLAAVPAARLAIAGDGPDRPALEDRAQALRIDEAVNFLGLTATATEIVRAMDVVVLPSWAESFPYTMLDAMAAARPIVATDVGGVAEAIVHRRTGLLVPARDAPALSEALVELLSDRGRARELAEAARELVVRRFTVERMVGGVAAVYREVLP